MLILRLWWVCVNVMVADGLTKRMKSPQLEDLMGHGYLKVLADHTPVKRQECEISDGT